MNGRDISAAMKAWFASEEAVECLGPGASGIYLRHRLEVAFLAGVAAAEASAKTFDAEGQTR